MRNDQAEKIAAAAAFAALSAIASIGMIGACNTEPSAKHGGSPEITIPQPHAKAPTLSPQDVRGADIPGPNPTIDGGMAEDGGEESATNIERGDAGVHLHHHHLRADGGT